jgi:hypothetical protein
LPKSEWRAVKWGLVPSDDILNKYSISNLKSLYPEKTEQELMNYRNAVLDENGNFRSTIYKKYYSDLITN